MDDVLNGMRKMLADMEASPSAVTDDAVNLLMDNVLKILDVKIDEMVEFYRKVYVHTGRNDSKLAFLMASNIQRQHADAVRGVTMALFLRLVKDADKRTSNDG